jgi:hypothetical protein
MFFLNILRSWGRSVSVVSGHRLDDRRSIPGRLRRIFPLAYVCRPVVRPTGVKLSRGVTLTTHSNLVPRSGMSVSCTSSPTWRLHGVAGQRYFFTEHFKIVVGRSDGTSRMQNETMLPTWDAPTWKLVNAFEVFWSDKSLCSWTHFGSSTGCKSVVDALRVTGTEFALSLGGTFSNWRPADLIHP